MSIIINYIFKSISIFLSLLNLNIYNTSTISEDNDSNVFIPNYVNINPLEGQDYYESNDSYDDAVNAFPENFYNFEEFSSLIDATLYSPGGYIDYEFYYFTVFTDLCVDIELISASTESFFSLIYFDYNIIMNEDDTYNALCNPITIVDNDNNQNFTSFSGILQPGTYFIYLNNSFNSNVVTCYQILLHSEKTDDSDDVKLNDLIYNKNCKGAIWMNDFIPFNFKNSLQITTEILYYDYGKQNLHYHDFALEKLSSVIGNQAVKTKVLYIWDPVLRRTLHQIFLSLKNIIYSELKDEQELAMRLELEHDIISNTLSIIGTVNEHININKVVSVPISLVLDVSEIVLDMFFDSLIPKISIDRVEYLMFLSNLTGTLDMNIGDNDNANDIEYLRDLQLLEIIQIPIYYEFIIESNRNKINYNVTCEKSIEYDSLLYGNSMIYANQCNINFMRGKIYAIEELGDLMYSDSLPMCSELLAEHTSIDLNEEVDIGSLHEDEYVWVEFTPLETNTYYFLAFGDSKVRIDVFDYKTKSYVDTNRLFSFMGGYTNINDSTCKGCYADAVLNEGKTYYFRIRGDMYDELNDITFIISENPRNDAVHVHKYITHVWLNNTQHESFCNCGDSIICGHSKFSQDINCALCGGRADIGFIGPFN